MAEMSMNKVIHRAVRRDLDRFVDALAAFHDADGVRARQLGTAWDNFDTQLTIHHEGEHEIAWPAMESIGVSKELLATFDDEHDRMAEALETARAAITALRTSASAADATAARTAMESLRAVTVAHLDHEEAETEDVYLANADGPEMKAMGKQFAKVSPAKGGRFFAWLLDGAAPAERAAVADTVPGPVLKILTGVFGRGYRKTVAPVWTH
jgi:hypothetical protein